MRKHLYLLLLFLEIMVLGIIICVIISHWTYLVKYHDDIKQQNYNSPTLTIYVNDSIVKSDTIIKKVIRDKKTTKTDTTIVINSALLTKQLQAYNQRVDTLENAIRKQREENNTIVDRSSAWLSFWLAVFALVLTIPGIYSIIQTRRNDRRMEKIRDESKIALSESKITALMICISQTLEPEIYNRNPDNKILLNQYLNILDAELRKSITHAIHLGISSQQDIECFLIIFLGLETLFSKVFLLETNPERHIELHSYLETLRNVRRQFIRISSLDTESINAQLKKIEQETKQIVQLFNH